MNVLWPDGTGTWRLNMTLKGMEDAWKRGLRGPLRTAEREISRLVERMELGVVSRPLVVISGGTARNPAVKSRLVYLCEAKGVSVVFTDEFNVPIAYELVATSSFSLTVLSFIRTLPALTSAALLIVRPRWQWLQPTLLAKP
jgi:hypothetical protein